jgi:hypothetical protein
LIIIEHVLQQHCIGTAGMQTHGKDPAIQPPLSLKKVNIALALYADSVWPMTRSRKGTICRRFVKPAFLLPDHGLGIALD